MIEDDFNIVAEDFTELQTVASDPEVALASRVEAFEDIIASEVGDTLFLRAKNIEREVGFRQIYLKFEGGNPTGTQKDRIAFAQVNDALRRDYKAITFATCGNYGAAVSFAAQLAGLECFVFIPANYHLPRAEDIKKRGAVIIRAGYDYEEAVAISSAYAAEHTYYDANPGAINKTLQLQAYGQIAYEIYDELKDAPAAIAVPVSNGTTLAGIYRGFEQLYRRGKTSRLPRMIAGSSSGKNPIVTSFQRKLHVCQDLIPDSIHESVVNEPLINWHSIDGQAALEAIYSTDGWAKDTGDRKMRESAAFIMRNEGLSVLPASTAGLIALIDLHHVKPLCGDRYVIVLTGRK